MSVANIGKLQENTAALCRKISQNVGRKYLEALRRILQACKMATKFRSHHLVISQLKADFAAKG